FAPMPLLGRWWPGLAGLRRHRIGTRPPAREGTDRRDDAFVRQRAQQALPNAHTLFRREVELGLGADVECLVPSVEISKGTDHAKAPRTVRVGGDLHSPRRFREIGTAHVRTPVTQ